MSLRSPGMMKRQQRIQGINGLSEQIQFYPLIPPIRCCVEQIHHVSGCIFKGAVQEYKLVQF